ncbi:MAG: hypothetical protein NTZ65_04825 [Candidatus Berkelbacteria bacterium]|nr:hypothetical protein [Candidatus Berkelbacteria bacterium]
MNENLPKASPMANQAIGELIAATVHATVCSILEKNGMAPCSVGRPHVKLDEESVMSMLGWDVFFYHPDKPTRSINIIFYVPKSPYYSEAKRRVEELLSMVHEGGFVYLDLPECICFKRLERFGVDLVYHQSEEAEVKEEILQLFGCCGGACHEAEDTEPRRSRTW